MKVSLEWLQKYFDTPLPEAAAVAEAYTFHAFEIEESAGLPAQAGDLLDVKVLPNRAADCLCHRGLARELGAILDWPLTSDPLRTPVSMNDLVGRSLEVQIEDPKKCARYMGALVRGVKIGPSPAWLQEAIEAVGQRSINNVVDATNYVMLNIGQPLHAFDATKMDDCKGEGKYSIVVRGARENEQITTLSGETFTMLEGALLIVDDNCDQPIGIAGVKGGKAAEVSSETTDIIIESANFDGTSVRRTAQALRLHTDASLRFQNRPSPELAAYGMRDVLALVLDIAGGEVVGVVDEYPARPEQHRGVSVSLAKINDVLGSTFSNQDVLNIFNRLDLPVTHEGDTFTIAPPFERTDLVIPEDLIEEVGRIAGYDQIPATELPPPENAPDQSRYQGVERMKDMLVEKGYTEISTQSFAAKGDIELANPLDKSKPALRTSLAENMQEALTRAKLVAPLVLAPGQKVRLFEVGTVFPKSGEYLALQMSVPEPTFGHSEVTDNLTEAKLEDFGRGYESVRATLGAFNQFSVYPFITRDAAYWGEEADDLIRTTGGPLITRIDLFDRFQKEGKTSLAYRLVFQSTERTLTDEEVNAIMEKVYTALRAKGYKIR